MKITDADWKKRKEEYPVVLLEWISEFKEIHKRKPSTSERLIFQKGFSKRFDMAYKITNGRI